MNSYMVEEAQMLDIVSGTFTPKEGEELLMKLISDQENFYKIKNLALDMRKGDQSRLIWQKVHALEEAKDVAKGMLEEARSMGLNVKITSHFDIELCDDCDDGGLYK